MDFKIAPSILSADFLHLEKDIRLINKCGDIIHLDIMDGSFVPNISFGFPIVEQVAKIAECPMDAHLMVVHPERWFEKLASYGVSYCSFHLETAKEDSEEFLSRIRDLGMQAGLAINPDVPVESLYPYIGKADFFLIMSVFAGFGGQKFIPESVSRVKALKREIEDCNSYTFIEIDGGINLDNIKTVRDAGVSVAVAGSSVFGTPDPAKTIFDLRQA